MTIDDSVIKIKQLIENAIITEGTKGRNNLIRTSIPIQHIHELVKDLLINEGINPNLIKPQIGQSRGELKLSGELKTKKQDICVINPNFIPTKEHLISGNIDIFGHEFTEHTLSINVRSQLSSVSKNFDTLYERSFAESLNLHMRCPKMVMGEIFMIPIKEYDQTANNIVKFNPYKTQIKKQIEKYIKYYTLINNRTNVEGDFFKYERISVLLVDFSKEIPKVYNTTEELLTDGLLPKNSTANMDNLSFTNFIKDLLDIYTDRFDNSIYLS